MGTESSSRRPPGEADAAPPAPTIRPLEHALAALVFCLAAGVVFAPLFRAGASDYVAMKPVERPVSPSMLADSTFQAWLVTRNARTLVTAPHRLFDAEHCAPAESTLAYGIPMVTMGLLGIPFALTTREPVLVFNATIVALTLVSAFAMYALVTRWTGLAAAGIVAGLLFGFQPLRLMHITHPSVWDFSWTVIAMLFAERLFAGGRWRDALGLSAAIALQVGASFYPLIAATFVAPPLLVWLLVRYGLRHVTPAQLAFVVGAAALTAAVLLLPYLGAETDDGRLKRTVFYYRSWHGYFQPWNVYFPGFLLYALVLVSAFGGRRRAAPGIGGDPRLALLFGALLTAAVAAGRRNADLFAWAPNLHLALASLIPGLDAVRGIHRFAEGAHAALTVLAGLGAGVLIRAAGPRRQLVACVLVAAAAIEVLGLPAVGLERRFHWRLERIRPTDTAIAFFEELERRGNRGPILELPVPSVAGSTKNILLSAYHHRRTSACFGSYRPAGREALAELSRTLPSPSAVEALAAQGFTTLVVDLARQPVATYWLERLETAATHDPGIVPVHRTREYAAFALHPEAASR